MAIIELEDVTMGYGSLTGTRPALHEVSLAIGEGEMAVLIGPSGSGKTTLLKLVLAMERPQIGRIRVAGRDIHRLRIASIPYLRRNVAAIFQDFKLLLNATPLENVALALKVFGLSRKEIDLRSRDALVRVEIDPHTRRPARSLSGGELQRVAIARALACKPAIVLADEPTGNLDPRLTGEILGLLRAIRAEGTTVVLATHDPLVQATVVPDRLLELRDGMLVGYGARTSAPSSLSHHGGGIPNRSQAACEALA